MYNNPYQRNALLAYLAQAQMQPPQNMLAAAEDGFDPDGPIARLIRQQRAAEAAKQMQQNPPGAGQPKAPQRPGAGSYESADETIRRRMREQGLQ